MVLIWLLSSSPQPFGEMELPFPHFDKLFHFFEFGLLGFFWLKSFLLWNRAKAACLALAITLLWAGVDEWHQSYVPGRQADIVDFLFDALGAFSMIVATLCFYRGITPSTKS